MALAVTAAPRLAGVPGAMERPRPIGAPEVEAPSAAGLHMPRQDVARPVALRLIAAALRLPSAPLEAAPLVLASPLVNPILLGLDRQARRC
jgi:hypothetical protein